MPQAVDSQLPEKKEEKKPHTNAKRRQVHSAAVVYTSLPTCIGVTDDIGTCVETDCLDEWSHLCGTQRTVESQAADTQFACYGKGAKESSFLFQITFANIQPEIFMDEN